MSSRMEELVGDLVAEIIRAYERSRKKMSRTNGVPDNVPDNPSLSKSLIIEDKEVSKKEREKEAVSRTNLSRTTPRGTRISPDWVLGEIGWQFARSRGLLDNDIKSEAQSFHDWWLQKAGPDGVKLDWSAAWRTWVSRTCQRRGIAAPSTSPAPSQPILSDERRADLAAKYSKRAE